MTTKHPPDNGRADKRALRGGYVRTQSHCARKLPVCKLQAVGMIGVTLVVEIPPLQAQTRNKHAFENTRHHGMSVYPRAAPPRPRPGTPRLISRPSQPLAPRCTGRRGECPGPMRRTASTMASASNQHHGICKQPAPWHLQATSTMASASNQHHSICKLLTRSIMRVATYRAAWAFQVHAA